MPEVKTWIEQVRRVDPPDLWDDIELRSRGPVQEPKGDRHVFRIAAVFITTFVVLGAALYGLSGLGSSTDGAATGPTPASSDMASYVNPMGIKIALDYPSDWYAQSVSQAPRHVGLVVSNTSQAMPSPSADSPSPGPLPENPNLPPDFVSLSILSEDRPEQVPGRDSSLPLSMDDASFTLGPGNVKQLLARVGGVPIVIQVSAGPNASATDLAAADAIVASIRPAETSAALVQLPEVLRGNPCVGSVELRFPPVPGSAQQLVPDSPGAAVECLLPTTHAVIRGEQLDRLVSALNALPRHPGRIRVCPGTAPSQELFFVYASGDVQEVFVPGSCIGSSITNGSFKAKMTALVLHELMRTWENSA